MLEFSRKAGMRRRLMFSCRVMQLRKDVSKESEEIYDERIRKTQERSFVYNEIVVDLLNRDTRPLDC
ncbi:hypothetical protein ISN45_Aa05g002250 [Arabidopsis thaliana x Arabidopsis arenosa]|uniref:Uncharacterized protein n=1 Tax=Arabidopsis thaliana x Arabidopsis arenosa TaxID=1240361 RepID=A0A8T1ZGL4_9BRAS|nr:hypothetical protein ISN45_Aa05g002250 [Arabidopsis thaliana x Arabidopsis arenosa]